MERRALLHFAGHADVAARLLDDAIDRGQPQSGAVANILRREERLEESAERVTVHADATVADRQTHVSSRLRLRLIAQLRLAEHDDIGGEREPAAEPAVGIARSPGATRRVCVRP